MKMTSVNKENMETFRESMLSKKEFEVIVEEVKTNKELAEKLAQIEEPADIEGYTDDFEKAVDTLNNQTEFLEIIRQWDLVDKLREYQGFFVSGYQFKDMYLTSPLPLVLVGLDKERTLLKYPEKWYEDHREELSKVLDLLIYRKKNEGANYQETVNSMQNLEGFISHHSLRKFPKVFSYLLMRSLKKDYIEDEDKRAVLPKYHKFIAKSFDSKIQEINPNLVKVTYASMVKDYFGLDLDESKNAPKLAKQLKKAGIDYTDEEIRHFGEVKNWWQDWNTTNFSTLQSSTFRARDLWVDKEDFKIPAIVDKWAFNDSCNKSDSGAGADTHLVLRHFGFEYLKGYSVGYTRERGYELFPAMRTYFLRKDDDIAHAGTYADFNGTRAKACYEFTTVLLCIFFNKRVDEFNRIEGMDIACDTYRDKKNNHINFWANQARNDYTKLGTAELFRDFGYDNIKNYVETNVSLRHTLGAYLNPTEYRTIEDKYIYFKGIPLTPQKGQEKEELPLLAQELRELA